MGVVDLCSYCLVIRHLHCTVVRLLLGELVIRISSGEMVCGEIVMVVAVESIESSVLVPLCMLALKSSAVNLPCYCCLVFVLVVVEEGSAYTCRVLEYMYSSVVCAVRLPRT